jgi:hypothetical protein
LIQVNLIEQFHEHLTETANLGRPAWLEISGLAYVAGAQFRRCYCSRRSAEFIR